MLCVTPQHTPPLWWVVYLPALLPQLGKPPHLGLFLYSYHDHQAPGGSRVQTHDTIHGIVTQPARNTHSLHFMRNIRITETSFSVLTVDKRNRKQHHKTAEKKNGSDAQPRERTKGLPDLLAPHCWLPSKHKTGDQDEQRGSIVL